MRNRNTFSTLRCTCVQLLAVCLETRDDLLTIRSDGPVFELVRESDILRLLANNKASRVQEYIVRIVSCSFEDGHLLLKLLRDRKVCTAIGESVLLQDDGTSESLNWECDELVVPSGVCSSPWHLRSTLEWIVSVIDNPALT